MHIERRCQRDKARARQKFARQFTQAVKGIEFLRGKNARPGHRSWRLRKNVASSESHRHDWFFEVNNADLKRIHASFVFTSGESLFFARPIVSAIFQWRELKAAIKHATLLPEKPGNSAHLMDGRLIRRASGEATVFHLGPDGRHLEAVKREKRPGTLREEKACSYARSRVIDQVQPGRAVSRCSAANG